MPAVDLTGQEWGQVMAILSTAPWRDANPLLMKIGDQLRAQPPTVMHTTPQAKPDGNGQEEYRHE